MIKTRWLSACAMAVILMTGALSANGQDTAEIPTISALREQIAKLLSVSEDPNLPADVKILNQRFLDHRRAQLKILVKKNVDALRTYRTAAGSVLTAAEIKVIDQTISDLERDLGDQQAGTSQVSVPVALSGDAGSVAAPARDASPGRILASVGGPSIATNPPAASPVPQASQNLTPKGSDVAGTNLVKDDVARQLAALTSEVTKAQAKPGVRTLAQARKEAFDITANPELYGHLLALILTNSMLPHDEFVRDIESARMDKQVGGAATNAGSTTLVTKGGTPAILGFAVENGALTRSVNGTTVTFRGNPVGIVEALQKKGFISSFEDDSESAKLLRKLSFSASFDTSRSDPAGTLLANRQQLSGYTLRYEFKNDRDPRNEKYKKDWGLLVTEHAQKVANDLGRVMKFLDTNPAYNAWLTAAKEAVGNATNAELANVIATQFDRLQAIPITPELAAIIDSYQSDFTAYRQGRSKLLEIIAKAPIFTVEYANARRPGLIDTSNLKVIAETGMFKGKGDLTYNGSLTFFNSNPGAGMKRIRDFNNSLRFDVPLGDVRKIGNFVLTFAGEYKRLMENEMTSAKTLMKVKGDIATGQVQFTIPIKGGGVKIPLSISFANRTEFVKEKIVRGNFGFTFDLDTIFAKFKPF